MWASRSSSEAETGCGGGGGRAAAEEGEEEATAQGGRSALHPGAAGAPSSASAARAAAAALEETEEEEETAASLRESTRVAAADEVGVQRVRVALLAGVARRHQRLPEDVPAKQIAKPEVQALPNEAIGRSAFEFEQFEKLTQSRAGAAGRRSLRRGVFLHEGFNGWK